jgi:hypothetical protein
LLSAGLPDGPFVWKEKSQRPMITGRWLIP